MILLTLLLRLCLFAALFYGFSQCVNRVLCVRAAFIPILSISVLCCALVLTGILNIMPVAVAAFLALGAYGFIKYPFWKNRFAAIRQNPVMLAFVAICAFYFAYFYGNYFNITDDFTHWGRVVKVLLRYNRLPRFTDSIIEFASYPAGTSVFVYLVCRVLGSQADGVMMFAQMIALASCVLPLTALVKRNRLASGALILLFAAFSFLCVPETGIWSLLVDILLPLACVAGVAIAYAYRDTIDEKWIALLPLTAFIGQIKNSGMFFVAVLAVQAGIYLFRCPRLARKQRWLRLAALVGASACLLVLWGQHADYVFEGGLVTRHSISPVYMFNTFLRKMDGTNAATVKEFFGILTNLPAMRQAISVFALALLLACTGALCRIRSDFRSKPFLISLACIYVAYLAGLLGMLLFNAPEGSLTSFPRYEATVHVLLMGVAAIYAIELLNAAPTAPFRAAALPIVCCVLLFAASLFSNHADVKRLFRYPAEYQTASVAFATRVPDRDKETRYLVYVYDGYKWFHYYNLIATYYLYPAQCRIVTNEDAASLSDWYAEYDYLIAYSPDDAYRAFAASYGIDADTYLWSRDAFLTAAGIAG